MRRTRPFEMRRRPCGDAAWLVFNEVELTSLLTKEYLFLRANAVKNSRCLRVVWSGFGRLAPRKWRDISYFWYVNKCTKCVGI